MSKWTTELTRLMVTLPDLLSLAGAEARIILALRTAVMGNKLQRDVRGELGEKLGSRQAVNRFEILIESVGLGWPDSFQLGRICCQCTTLDEITLITMMRHAASGDRPGFDALTCEMIGPCERERIYGDMRGFASCYHPAPLA